MGQDTWSKVFGNWGCHAYSGVVLENNTLLPKNLSFFLFLCFLLSDVWHQKTSIPTWWRGSSWPLTPLDIPTPPSPPSQVSHQTKLLTLLCGDFQGLWPTPPSAEISNWTCGGFQTTQPQNVEQYFLCTQRNCGLNSGPSHLKKMSNTSPTVPWLERKVKRTL